MADTDVGKRATRTNAHGEKVVCDILDYSAGKDAGDHYVFGGSTPKEKDTGGGETFTAWLVVGDGAGTIKIH